MKKHHVVVSELMDPAGLELLDEHHHLLYDPTLFENRRFLLEVVGNAGGLVVRNRTRVDAELWAAAPTLKVVGRLGAGLDNIDLYRANEHGATVVYAPGFNARAVAEWILGAVLHLLRQLGPAHCHVRGGGWSRALFAGTELAEHVLGVLGFGRVARVLAGYLRPAGVRLLTYHPRLSPDDAELASLNVQLVSLEELLARSTILVVLLPLTETTRGMVSEAALRCLPRGALLVVAGRGSVVDEGAAVRLLREGALGGAAFDVFEREPPPAELLAAAGESVNLLLSPHAAGWTAACQRSTSVAVAQDVLRVLAGQEPRFAAVSPTREGVLSRAN